MVGKRWTLLVVREFLLGSRRFTDLLAALPGLGTSRLKQQETAAPLMAGWSSGTGREIVLRRRRAGRVVNARVRVPGPCSGA